MTRDGDWSAADPRQGHQQTGGGDTSRVESLLHSLINRLEENDSRYNAALASLEQRLGELSSRAGVAGGDDSRATAEALGRVGAEAAGLAQEVRQAEQAQHARAPEATFRGMEDRIGQFAAHLQQDAPEHQTQDLQHATPPGDDPTFGQRFATAAASFEQSLAAGHPTAELDALNARMNELMQRFDSAIGGGTDVAALRSIEEQINGLSVQFAQAQQHYARVDAIEANLVRLMEWAQQSGSQVEAAAMKAAQQTVRHMGGDASDITGRLDAVQRELHALAERTREIDGRTVGALESMNAALKSLNRKLPEGASRAPEPPPPPQASAEPRSAPAQTSPGAAAAPGQPPPQPIPVAADPARSQVGASIPDYQEMPGTYTPQQGSAGAPQAPPQNDNGARIFDDADFLASARRASAAAAARPVEEPKRKSLLSGLLRKGQSEPSPARENKGPRPLLVVGAILLLVAGSSLIYGRLKDRADDPDIRTPGQSLPVPPAAAPAAPKTSRHDEARPGTREKKDHSKLPTGPAVTSSDTPRRAPLVIEKPAAAPGQQTGLNPDADADAAPKLASLPKLPVDPHYPGIAVSITEAGQPEPSAATPTPQAVTPPAHVPPSVPRPSEPAATPAPAPAPRVALPPPAIGPQSLRLAAAGGNAAAQFEIGSRYAKGSGIKRDYSKAAEWYARAAAQSLAPAQYRLAALYERGRGVEKDPAMARAWYERAAKQGNVKAMHNLAVILSGAGTGQDGDPAEALKWFTQAARHGLADSQFNLGIIYEAGLGVKKSALEAYQWFALAAARGDKEAEKRRQRVKLQLRPDSLLLAEQSVRLWRARPMDAGANDVRPPRGGWRSVAAARAQALNDPLVARAQTLLNKLGYDAGVADGLAGPQTVSAIRRFESRSGLEVGGKVTPDLVKRLEALAS